MSEISDLQKLRAELLLRIASLRSSVRDGDKAVTYDLAQAENSLKILGREIKRLQTTDPWGGPTMLTVRSTKDL